MTERGAPPTHAVVDRIVEGTAVLLVGEDEEEHRLGAEDLPAGADEGSWLLVEPGPPLTILGSDPEAEQRQRRRVEERMERLRGRRGGRFGEPPDG